MLQYTWQHGNNICQHNHLRQYHQPFVIQMLILGLTSALYAIIWYKYGYNICHITKGNNISLINNMHCVWNMTYCISQLAYNDVYWHNICQSKIPYNNKIIYINIFPYSFGLPVFQGEHSLRPEEAHSSERKLVFQLKKLFCLKRKLSLQEITWFTSASGTQKTVWIILQKLWMAI